ncbi:LegC family aminotransferase [Helicobacter cholecystus]|uniref:LegC family aminotransferase n=1 Tax=Helicobacter cholecystus TaxID=45498 RepID=UPI00273A0DFB|nr:LegC family aminotransferase [Helicobacter cholecystus]
MSDFSSLFNFIRELYFKTPTESVPLHEPRFLGNEKLYLNECIDSGFVSSVGEFVNKFEKEIAYFCGSKYAIACSNGTSALHAILHTLGINEKCEVITQALSFIATSNAIAYTRATPIYVDVDLDTLSLSPNALQEFLYNNAQKQEHCCINKHTGKIIKACVPMHTFGHPARIEEISRICKEWNILLIEDSAESLGSYYLKDRKKIHTGREGIASVLSLNGNKTITCGGGGVILSDNEALAKKLKHITTTAKIPHPYEYNHDMLGFNYRLPNLNAALALAQLEQLPTFLQNKLEVAKAYEEFCFKEGIDFINARKDTMPNFWLNAIKLENKKQRDDFLIQSNASGIITRPIWTLSHHNPMYTHCQHDGLKNSLYLQDRIVNLPSSVRILKT